MTLSKQTGENSLTVDLVATGFLGVRQFMYVTASALVRDLVCMSFPVLKSTHTAADVRVFVAARATRCIVRPAVQGMWARNESWTSYLVGGLRRWVGGVGWLGEQVSRSLPKQILRTVGAENS